MLELNSQIHQDKQVLRVDANTLSNALVNNRLATDTWCFHLRADNAKPSNLYRLSTDFKYGNARVNSSSTTLTSKFCFSSADLVWNFLERNQYLIPFLEEAHEYLRIYFPHNELSLLYTKDVEEPEESYLSIKILISKTDFETSRKALANFRNHWWMPTYKSVNGKVIVCITL